MMAPGNVAYPHSTLTHQIIGAFYTVHNELGAGSSLSNALCSWIAVWLFGQHLFPAFGDSQ